MAAEREPPPLGDGKPTDFEELEDGEDLFTSTVSTLEMIVGVQRSTRYQQIFEERISLVKKKEKYRKLRSKEIVTMF